MVVGEGICKRFGVQQALSDVNVSVHPGEITALIGPSGGGKSTLLRALGLLEPPDRGRIRIDGKTYVFDGNNHQKIEPSPWPQLTIVFQQLFLWPHMTIRQNITLPLQNFVNSEHWDRDEEVEKFVDLFAMHEFIDRYPNQASLGQRQRAAIARALVLKPTYLLLDEITSALDVEHVAILLGHLRQLRDEGTGILLVTHLIGFAKRAADRVFFMENGRILDEGGPEILVAPSNGRLAQFLSLLETAS